MKGNSRAASQKTAIQRGNMPIADYLKLKQEYDSYPGRIKRGIMFIFYRGKWIKKTEFDKVVKRPNVPDFKTCLLNVDTTKLWMHR